MPNHQFSPGDLVWVKLRGFPHWPARIDEIVKTKYKMFYFGTHEKGCQAAATLSPFAPNRDKYTLYRGSCPKALIEGVLEAENNPNAKPEDTLSEVNTDTQIWIVLGPEGRADFEKRYPERAAKAKLEFESYTKEMNLKFYQQGVDDVLPSTSEADAADGEVASSLAAANKPGISTEKDEKPRKRLMSENIITAGSEEPSRKRRRTVSESTSTRQHDLLSYTKENCPPENKQKVIDELNKCLRYSLRKSYLNEDAADLILNDIEALTLSSEDNLDNLRSSLQLITKLKKLPRIQSRCRFILESLPETASV